MELDEGLRRVAVVGEEFDDGAARVLKVGHVVELAVDEHVLRRRILDGRRRELLRALAHFLDAFTSIQKPADGGCGAGGGWD